LEKNKPLREEEREIGAQGSSLWNTAESKGWGLAHCLVIVKVVQGGVGDWRSSKTKKSNVRLSGEKREPAVVTFDPAGIQIHRTTSVAGDKGNWPWER